MFCPNCGIKIENPNQRFCKACGQELLSISVALKEKINPNSIPLDPNNQFIELKQIKKKEPHSKLTLGFGIASIMIGGTAFQFGASFISFPLMDIFPRFIPIVFIILSIIHIIGLIFGFLSKINNQKAREMESMNTFIKVGNVLGIIGIIFNSILLVISFVIIGLLW